MRLALEEEDIEARPVWKPLHLQPLFTGREVRGGAVAEDLFRHIGRTASRIEHDLRIARRDLQGEPAGEGLGEIQEWIGGQWPGERS